MRDLDGQGLTFFSVTFEACLTVTVGDMHPAFLHMRRNVNYSEVWPAELGRRGSQGVV